MFLFLGRLTEEKGLRVLLDAWEIVEQTSTVAHLTITGDGPLAAEVQRRCEGMKRATWVGFKTGEDKRQLLRNTTALIVPSIWWEPLGLVLYEAYDYGKPVLAARSGGIVDHVVDELTGLLHEPGDFHALASHILAAIADPASCRSMGVNGRKLLLERNTNVWIHEFDDFVGKVVRDSNIGTSALATGEAPIRVQVYLADQNPGHDRSIGISRMSHVVLDQLATSSGVEIRAITSKTSQKAPDNVRSVKVLPWGTRSKSVRLLTDHLHPLFRRGASVRGLHYFPKGYLPLLNAFCQPSVVTIHDTIIQYDEDHYPHWRQRWEYAYWAMMLKHTLRKADRILTVSESSKQQIHGFMDRHGIPRKEITVTYEPCLYEKIPQPVKPEKDNYVIHLASCEPHKRTADLIRWWHEAETKGRSLPTMHLIGTVPPEVAPLLASSRRIVKRPFLEDEALRTAYLSARALILPSEIEGFGLPALEAYYLGTPVCFVKGTSVEEILGWATDKGGFSLESAESLFFALDEVMRMSPEEIRACGLKLRETYAAEKVTEKMVKVFRGVAAG
jgi:glycosyltransferase involved in cell wall biosynthesis